MLKQIPYILFFTLIFAALSMSMENKEIILKNERFSVSIVPETLEVRLKLPKQEWNSISSPVPVREIQNIMANENMVGWEIPAEGISVLFELKEDRLNVHFTSNKTDSFTWPVIKDREMNGYILPLFEGSYVPAEDKIWKNFLIEQGSMYTEEALSMPFWGMDRGDYTVTYILENPFNNKINFLDNNGFVGIRLKHNFTENWEKKEYGFTIIPGEASPVEPAKKYREYLIENNEFVTFKEKTEKIPDAEKLAGAIHIYLWGGEMFSVYDVKDWRKFAKALSVAEVESPAEHIWGILSEDGKNSFLEMASLEYEAEYLKRGAVYEMNEIMMSPEFYNKDAWENIELSSEIKSFINKDISSLKKTELYRLNSLLLKSAFPDFFADVERWGAGVSLKQLEKFKESGLDRLWLGLDSWKDGARHPDFVKEAIKSGYLTGPYDSYHSIHDPENPGWETAVFDMDLYEKGPIVKADGTKKSGFMGRGYILSSLAALPYVKDRVSNIMNEITFNSWFIDCDAYGELFDDYSPFHRGTKEDDMNARCERMKWISESYNLVVGSEKGAWYSAPVIHFAHGMTTPVIGWSDPDMDDKNSEYYVGAWWPSDGPTIFLRQVPIKEKYRYIYYEPKFRLPLYQTVFHDSIITTHHWQYHSLKFTNVIDDVSLLEILYSVPPLYHINPDEFEKHKDRIIKEYKIFSPLHRETVFLPMTDFSWVTDDRLVQKTTFGNELEIVANFSMEKVNYNDVSIPAKSVYIIRSGENYQVWSPLDKD